MTMFRKLMRALGYVPEASIPVVGATMVPDDKQCAEVEVLETNATWVKYQAANGGVRTRSRRGFMKHYTRKL